MGAVLFSNIPETIKTRLQLDGELADPKARQYKGIVDAFRKTWQYEGIRGLHAGLVPALMYQAIMNGLR
jgi:solute carrier family 25 protein 34/35